MRSVKWWQSRFPEDLYPATAGDYVERVLTGFEIASRSSCTIAGLCRDGEAYLPEILARIEKLASLIMIWYLQMRRLN